MCACVSVALRQSDGHLQRLRSVPAQLDRAEPPAALAHTATLRGDQGKTHTHTRPLWWHSAYPKNIFPKSWVRLTRCAAPLWLPAPKFAWANHYFERFRRQCPRQIFFVIQISISFWCLVTSLECFHALCVLRDSAMHVIARERNMYVLKYATYESNIFQMPDELIHCSTRWRFHFILGKMAKTQNGSCQSILMGLRKRKWCVLKIKNRYIFFFRAHTLVIGKEVLFLSLTCSLIQVEVFYSNIKKTPMCLQFFFLHSENIEKSIMLCGQR